MEVKIKLLDGQMPAYSREGDACLDCFAAEDLTLRHGERKKIRLGFALEIPNGFEALIRPRSGLSLKGLDVKLGTIDSNYRGEVNAIVHYGGRDTFFKISKGDRIAQMAIRKSENVVFSISEELSETIRGEKGFGSSGV